MYLKKFHTLIVNQWDMHDFVSVDDVMSEIRYNAVNRIIWFAPTEYETWFAPKFVEYINQQQIKMELVYGSADTGNGYYDQFKNLFDRVDIHFWPTFLFHYTYYDLMETKQLDPVREYHKFKYPFITMIRRANPHRSRLMDVLAREKLLDRGCYSWANINAQPKDFQYFDHTKVVLLHKGGDWLYNNTYADTTDEFYSSLVHVVPETTTDVFFITENTLSPLFMKKIHVTLGVTGFTKQLEQLGIKKFKGIDYAFDNVESMPDRVEELVKSIQPLLDCSLEEFYQLNKDIVAENFSTAMDIINTDKHAPDIIKEVKDIVGNGFQDRCNFNKTNI
jgi:hypothetical protein